jgi:hypothetical protein
MWPILARVQARNGQHEDDYRGRRNKSLPLHTCDAAKSCLVLDLTHDRKAKPRNALDQRSFSSSSVIVSNSPGAPTFRTLDTMAGENADFLSQPQASAQLAAFERPVVRLSPTNGWRYGNRLQAHGSSLHRGPSRRLQTNATGSGHATAGKRLRLSLLPFRPQPLPCFSFSA